MGQEEERRSLYDYFYIDNERIASFYAQIYGGLLKEISKQTKSGEAAQIEPKGTIGVASLKGSFEESIEEGKVETLIPGDVIIEDVLSALLEFSKLRDIDDASENEFFLVEGSVTILPKELIPTIFEQFVNLLSIISHKDLQMRKEEKRKFEKLAKEMTKILKSLPWDTLLYLNTGDNLLLVGNLKESFIRENITSLLLKHLGQGMPSCYLLGVKEGIAPSSLPVELQEIVTAHVRGLTEYLIPQDAIWVTPVTVFRKVK